MDNYHVVGDPELAPPVPPTPSGLGKAYETVEDMLDDIDNIQEGEFVDVKEGAYPMDRAITKLGDCGLSINNGSTTLSESIRNFKKILFVCADSTWVRGSIEIPQIAIATNNGFEISYVWGSGTIYTAVVIDSDTTIHADTGSHGSGIITVYGEDRIND